MYTLAPYDKTHSMTQTGGPPGVCPDPLQVIKGLISQKPLGSPPLNHIYCYYSPALKSGAILDLPCPSVIP